MFEFVNKLHESCIRKYNTIKINETFMNNFCRNPTLKECEDDTHTPEMGTWKSSWTPRNSQLDYRGQNTWP